MTTLHGSPGCVEFTSTLRRFVLTKLDKGEVGEVVPWSPTLGSVRSLVEVFGTQEETGSVTNWFPRGPGRSVGTSPVSA